MATTARRTGPTAAPHVRRRVGAAIAVAAAAVLGACGADDALTTASPGTVAPAPGTATTRPTPQPDPAPVDRPELTAALSTPAAGPCPLLTVDEVATAAGVAVNTVAVVPEGTDPAAPSCGFRAGEVDLHIELAAVPDDPTAGGPPPTWATSAGPEPTLPDGSRPAAVSLTESTDRSMDWEVWGGFATDDVAVLLRVTGGPAPVNGRQPGPPYWGEGRTAAIAGALLRDVAARL